MARKEHLQSNIFYVLCLYFVMAAASGCNTGAAVEEHAPVKKDYSIDTSMIPKDTVLYSDQTLSVNNGTYFLNNERFSGIIKEFYRNGHIKSFTSVSQGILHGLYKSFYEDGTAFEVRTYRSNVATGRHYGYWPGGKGLKFDYNYYEEKREGPQKKWYRNGQPYLFTNYVNDREEGLQQGWRENGKLFLNYVAKDGHAYGLQQTALCYTLLNEKTKINRSG